MTTKKMKLYRWYIIIFLLDSAGQDAVPATTVPDSEPQRQQQLNPILHYRNGETETHGGRVMFKVRDWHRGIHSLNKCCCSLAESHPILFDPVDCSMPGSPVLHYLLEFVQIHVH